MERPDDEPEAALDFDERLLPRPVRAELRGLPLDLAHEVMAHLIAAGELIDEDPALANRHAQAARRRAARLPMVREAAAETAYAAEDYATALTEYRAVARMTGSDEYLPVIADCERAMGRHDRALRTIRQGHAARLGAAQHVELVLVEAGLRHDMGQDEEALRVLRRAIEDGHGGSSSQARLRYACADILAQRGDVRHAVTWFTAAGRLDGEHALDVADRLEALGAEVPDDFRASIDETDDDLYVEEQEPEDEPGPEPGAGDEPEDEPAAVADSAERPLGDDLDGFRSDGWEAAACPGEGAGTDDAAGPDGSLSAGPGPEEVEAPDGSRSAAAMTAGGLVVGGPDAVVAGEGGATASPGPGDAGVGPDGTGPSDADDTGAPCSDEQDRPRAGEVVAAEAAEAVTDDGGAEEGR